MHMTDYSVVLATAMVAGVQPFQVANLLVEA